ncbi:MAG TPA: hypothetical protein VMI11_15410 [Actinomycetes bacterium]|nr:hypothetical protein [Actinomycetes bacterium]
MTTTPHDAAPDPSAERARLRALLEDVAAGRVDPDVAAQHLAGSGGPAASAGLAAPAGSGGPAAPPAAPGPDTASSAAARPAPGAGAGSTPSVRVLPGQQRPGPGQAGEAPIRRVVLSVAAGKVVVVGDPTVAGAEAHGPVIASREGDAIRLDNRPLGEGGFRFERGGPWGRWRQTFTSPETITVRMNPALPLELGVAAGSAQVSGIRGGLTFRVDAGSLKAFDGAGRLEGRVASGSAHLEWCVREGENRLRTELGTLKLRLLPGSDVTVSARTEMGSMELGSGVTRGEDGRRRIVVGEGTAELAIDVELGSAKVAAP